MTTLKRSRGVAAAVAVAAICAAVVGFVVVPNLVGGTTAEIATGTPSLSKIAENVDVVLVVSDLRAEGVQEVGIWEYQTMSMTVDEVAYQADTTLSELRVGEDIRDSLGTEVRSEPLSPVAAGDRVAAHDVIAVSGSSDPSVLVEKVDPATSYVVMLQFVDRRLFVDYPTDWAIEFVSTNDTLTDAEFPHSYGSQWSAQLDTLVNTREEVYGIDVAGLLSDWVQGVDTERAGLAVDPGSLYALVKDNPIDALPSLEERWFASSPDVRPLDPELTPESVLEDLESVTVFVEVDGLNTDRQYLVIRNDMGISHVAEISAGNHPATIRTPLGATWVIELTNENGADRVRVGEVVPGESWTTGDLGVLRVAGAGSESAAVTFASATKDDFDDAIERQVELMRIAELQQQEEGGGATP